MIIHRMPQRSPEWFEIRRGKLTASNAQAIATGGKGLETYVYTILAEKYSKNKESYTNGDIERGIELEQSAIMTYEIQKLPVEIVGFVEQDELVGCSPDGLVGQEGGVEVKCPDDKNYFKVLINGLRDVDSKYIWQCQMCLQITGREWWDLIFYNPNFDNNTIIFRITPEISKQEKLIMGIERGKNLIKDITQKYGQYQN